VFIVLLKFSNNRALAGEFMEAHKAWIRQGFEDGVFLLVGSLQLGTGGGILAHNTALPDLQERVCQDPFVAEQIVEAEIIELAPSRADDRLGFLLV